MRNGNESLLRMINRIRAAALIVNNNRLLLIKHVHPTKGTEFWVPPGGGLEGGESIFECATREAYEESGLKVVPGKILYIREFVDLELQRHNVEFFILAHSFEGEITINHVRPQDLDSSYIRDVQFKSCSEMAELLVFPKELKTIFWRDLSTGELDTRYIGLQTGTEGHYRGD